MDDGQDVYVGRPESTPRVLIYDPYLASLTPRADILPTAFNALDHTLDLYLGQPLNSRVAEVMAIAAGREFVNVMPDCTRAFSIDASHRLQVAGITAGLCIQELAVHQLGRFGLLHAVAHALKHHGAPQGVAHTITMPAVLSGLARAADDRNASFGEAVGLPDRHLTTAVAARATIDYLEAIRDGVNVPTRLTDVMDNVDADAIAGIILADPDAAEPLDLSHDVIVDVVNSITQSSDQLHRGASAGRSPTSSASEPERSPRRVRLSG